MLVRLLPVAALLALPSCTTYFEDPADPVALAAQIRERPGGRFTFAAAVTTAFAQNAELQALAARARAAGAVTTPIEVQAEWRSERETLAVMLDPIALLGLGPRGGEIGTVEAEAGAAVQALATARWRVTAAIAEAFAVHEALAPLDVPDITIDAAAFERAGLAGPVAAARVRAAQARAGAEALELANARAANLATLRELLGLHRDTPLELESPDEVQQPPAGDASLLQRPDLTLAAARFDVADAEFRRAVADQYPSLMIGPEFALTGGPLAAMAVLRLPVGMHGRAAAAGDRREAARADLAAAYLAASREAHEAQLDLTAATA
ncbi:MAG TPA: hypothetical protein VFZ65_01895, partial [Planctomycetota bacterium]|nr:hypothetical protein [Planctomycetota bacterium]